jgi:GH15 family glucan-1,4-alpha-glucosidase
VLDASLLLMPLMQVHRADATRAGSRRSTRSRDELVSDSLVYRYNVEASPDGLDGDEGTFSICSFWYVEALARAAAWTMRGSLREDAHVREPPRLYSEEIGPSASCSATSPRPSPTSR